MPLGEMGPGDEGTFQTAESLGDMLQSLEHVVHTVCREAEPLEGDPIRAARRLGRKCFRKLTASEPLQEDAGSDP
jgi:hypothetical protein